MDSFDVFFLVFVLSCIFFSSSQSLRHIFIPKEPVSQGVYMMGGIPTVRYENAHQDLLGVDTLENEQQFVLVVSGRFSVVNPDELYKLSVAQEQVDETKVIILTSKRITGETFPRMENLQQGRIEPEIAGLFRKHEMIRWFKKYKKKMSSPPFSECVLHLLSGRSATDIRAMTDQIMFVETGSAPTAAGTCIGDTCDYNDSVDMPLTRATHVGGLPKGWWVYYRAVKGYPQDVFRYEGTAKVPPPLWRYQPKIKNGVYQDVRTQKRKRRPVPRFSKLKKSDQGSEEPRIFYGIISLQRKGKRYNNVKKILKKFPQIQLIKGIDGEGNWSGVKKEASKMGLKFNKWHTWSGKIAGMVVYLRQIFWLHENRKDYDYGVILEDDVELPDNFIERVTQLARRGTGSRRLGICASADMINIEQDAARMIARVKRIPIRLGSDLYFGVGPDAINPAPHYTFYNNGREIPILLSRVLPPGGFVHALPGTYSNSQAVLLGLEKSSLSTASRTKSKKIDGSPPYNEDFDAEMTA